MDGLNNVSKDIIKHSARAVARVFKKILRAPDDRVERLTPNEEALKKALQQCRKEIKRCKRWKVMPSKKCLSMQLCYQDKLKTIKKKLPFANCIFR